MQRTQVYLRDDQQEKLTRFSRRTGKKKSDLIRESIDLYIQRNEETQDWKENIMNLAGCWEDYEDIDEVFLEIRSSSSNRIKSF